MSVLYNQCLVAYKGAEYFWRCAADDDMFINSTCFQLQQCMEFGLNF